MSVVPVPLPSDAEVWLSPPAEEESRQLARGLASALAPDGRLTDLQRILLTALVHSMTGTRVDLSAYAPMAPHELAEQLRYRNLAFRTRVLQNLLLGALVLRPLPSAVMDRVVEVSAALGVDEAMVHVAREFSAGSLGLAGVDFQRNGYTATWEPSAAQAFHTSRELLDAWDSAYADAALTERWRALGDLPDGTLGRGVWQMYQARGFVFPGLPNSAPPLLAQHDWVHVLADYGTTVESELEVFAFIARANDDARAFSLLAMVVSLFETGYLRSGAGLFEASQGHLSNDHRVAIRLADAMRRGALCHDRRTGSDSIDYLMLDWFALADQPVADVRVLLHVVPKADEAIVAGSVGPWEPGGISPFQLRAGRAAAEAEGRDYDAHGASLAGGAALT